MCGGVTFMTSKEGISQLSLSWGPLLGQQPYLDEVQQCLLELQPGEGPAGHGGGFPVL